MKTKFLRILTFAFLAIGTTLTSCSDDNPDIDGGDNGNGNGGTTVYEKGYFSMTINADSNTKAYTEGDTETGTAGESKINSAVVVLYNPSTDATDPNKVAYQFPLGAIPGTFPGNGYHAQVGTSYITSAEQVDKKDYKLVVFVNPSADILTATEKGKALSLIQGVKGATVASLTGTTASPNFLMGNFAGLVDVKEDYIKDSKSGAEAAPVYMYVERAVAKVTVEKGSSFADGVAPVTDAAWTVDVTNKSTYWLRQQTKRLTGTQGTNEANTVDEEVEINPVYRKYMYAKSPYFEETSLGYYSNTTPTPSWGTAPNATTLGNQYNYVTSIAAIDNTAFDPGVDYEYVTENTMVADEQWEDVTTSVLLKVVLTPALSALNSDLSSAANDYFVYKNKVFTGAELELIRTNDFYYNTSTNQIVGSSGTNIVDWAAFEALTANTDLRGFQSYLQQDATRTAITGSAAGLYSTLPAASKEVAGGLKFFKGGVNVYNIPIRHFSNTLQKNDMKYGRYGVVRNNVYHLTINKITNYGDITIPKKENPDDRDSWLSVQFEILPWLVRDQQVEL